MKRLHQHDNIIMKRFLMQGKILLLGLALFAAPHVFAASIARQLVPEAANAGFGSGVVMKQQLGYGLTGTVLSLGSFFVVDSGFASTSIIISDNDVPGDESSCGEWQGIMTEDYHSCNLHSPYVLNPSHSYQLIITPGVSTAGTKAFGSTDPNSYTNGYADPTSAAALNTVADYVFDIGDALVNETLDTSIISLTPDNEQIASTTSITLELNAFINIDDITFPHGAIINLIFYDIRDLEHQTLVSERATTSGQIVYTFDEGTLATGDYVLEARIFSDYFYFNTGSYDYKKSVFTIGSSTLLGRLADRDDILNGSSITATSTLNQLKENCNPLSNFDMVECFSALTFPSSSDFQGTLGTIQNNFTTSFPIGYLTRFIGILTEPATSSLPQISYTFAADLGVPFLEGNTLAFDPNQILADGTEIVSNLKSTGDDPQTVWEILMPVIDIAIYLMLLFIIINDITGIHKGNAPSVSRKENT